MILILGCSFSMGWYSWDGNAECDTVHRDYCWYDELEKPYRAYAHPGGGLMSYCKCLDVLLRRKSTPASISAILIQETFCPRIVIQDTFEYKQHRENVYGWSSWKDLAYLNTKSDGWEYLNTACSSHLDRIAESTGLPVYSYSFTGKKYPYKYIKYLDVPPATETLFWDNRYHHFRNEDDLLHFNKAGNKKLGQMIKKGLDNELANA